MRIDIKKICGLVLFSLFFLLDATFRIREYSDKGVDFQVAIKFIVFILCFLFVVKQVKYLKTTNPIFAFFLAFSTFSFTWSVTPVYSLYTAVNLTVFYFFIHFTCLNYGVIYVRRLIILALTTFMVISIIYYIFIPELGRFMFWHEGVFQVSNRMSGLAGSANNFARIISVYILFMVFWGADVFQKKRMRYFFIGVALVCLIISGSRTTIATLSFSLFIYYYLISNSKSKAHLAIILMACVFFIALVSFELLQMISRDGGNDILTLTGRTHIWEVVIYMISESPIIGHGYASTFSLLPQYDDIMGHSASHSHNMYLQILITTGVIGLSAFILSILSICRLCILLTAKKEFILTILILLIGILESGAFALMPNVFTLTLLFVFASLQFTLINKRN